MHSFVGVKDSSYRMQFMLFLPEDVEILSYKNSPSHLKKHIEVLSFTIFICYASSWYGGYTVPAICEMCFAIVFFCIYMMGLDKQFTSISWVWSDFFRAFTGTVVYLITSLICVIRGYGDGALIAGGVFGLLAGLLFAYDTYTIYLQIKSARSQTESSGGTA